MKVGDAITKVNNSPVSSPRELAILLPSAKATNGLVPIKVARNHMGLTLKVSLGQAAK
jgi:S1-C subfamily serine protease